jgi:hypothetical protein
MNLENNNDFIVNNLATSDQMLDGPTNNFCTLNPLLYELARRFRLSESSTAKDF